MHIDDFKEIVATFADPGTEMLFEKHRILFSINGELIEATITAKAGDIYVSEGTELIPAGNWILKRLAKLPLLAARLIEQISQQEYFVSPSADLLPSLESRPDGTLFQTTDALNSMLNTLSESERSPLETTVLYITSDAGEGKSWLINAAAREQAKRYSAGTSDWLLVPIQLGGRHFLRFDDITVGALQNKYRFPFLYYNSFLALVRMGVIVPAFDGFEEMFVENSSGEALSAMGILVGALNSAGAVVVAARKAYFEFENLKSQEKLYDTINNYSVGFSKLELLRWNKSQFIDYCEKRGVEQANKIYERVSQRLGETHSLLTRPVLVQGLVNIAQSSTSLDVFLEKINASGADFFSVFVRGIVDREAVEKWIDRSGDVGSSLLSTDEHCELLAQVSIYMWESRVDYLKRDHLDFVADFFCESKRKNAHQSQQIRERIRGHALLVASPNVTQAVEFDHDEFRLFFLGEGLAELISPLNMPAKSEVLNVLRKGVLPEHSQLAFIRSIKRNHEPDRLAMARFLIEVGQLDGQASYTQENCGSLVMRLISELDADKLVVEGLAFGVDSLRDCKLKNVVFQNCYFAHGSWDITSLAGCTFRNGRFGQIRLYESTNILDTTFEDCLIDSVRIEEKSLELFEPAGIQRYLESIGARFGVQQRFDEYEDEELPEMDLELQNIEKVLRYFMRSTHISESVIRIRLGDRGQAFIDNQLPSLVEAKVLSQIDNRGSSHQGRFKLGLPLQKINSCISSAQGSYSEFLRMCNPTQ